MNFLGLHVEIEVYHQVVGQQHGKGLAGHDVLGAQHGMAQAQHAVLAHVRKVHVFHAHRAQQLQQALLARGFELVFELVGGVEMVFNGALVAAGDEHHVPDAGGVGFFDGVLDQRLVHHRQHFLGLGLGGRQKARAQASDGEDGDIDGRIHEDGKFGKNRRA